MKYLLGAGSVKWERKSKEMVVFLKEEKKSYRMRVREEGDLGNLNYKLS